MDIDEYEGKGYWPGWELPRVSEAVEQVQVELHEIATCECGHQLGVHIPDPNRLFAWPCRVCECREYKKAKIYIVDAAARDYTMMFVRVSLQSGHARVFEGLTNR